MKNIGIIFPHQLFKENSLENICTEIYLIEEALFFNQYNFHKRKIAFHRASMQAYKSFLKGKGLNVKYMEAQNDESDIRVFLKKLREVEKGEMKIHFIDPTDDWLKKRIKNSCNNNQILYNELPSTLFLNSVEELKSYFSQKKRFFQTDFYINYRKKNHILSDLNNQPLGGKWSFDDINRLKYPKNKIPPKVEFPSMNGWYQEAISYTEKNFPNNYGDLNSEFLYPCTHEDAEKWLLEFLEKRFIEFGAYEDAIVSEQHFLNHSLLTPMLNVGLITPNQIVDITINFSEKNKIPINSLEGFIRQIVGWREFIRAVYEIKGGYERTKNFWGFKRKIPTAFWDGTTGIYPIDQTIQKTLKTGYCHHIERLMILGNFMLLCEFDPDEVYRWFMELFIDSFDWVMVPNVYGMSQFADGGLMATKPYISSSNYIMKMSDYPKGDWQPIWDALFWRFMHNQRFFFEQNPRLGLLIKTMDKMPQEKIQSYIDLGDNFLKQWD